jgi:hypothetical protein
MNPIDLSVVDILLPPPGWANILGQNFRSLSIEYLDVTDYPGPAPVIERRPRVVITINRAYAGIRLEMTHNFNPEDSTTDLKGHCLMSALNPSDIAPSISSMEFVMHPVTMLTKSIATTFSVGSLIETLRGRIEIPWLDHATRALVQGDLTKFEFTSFRLGHATCVWGGRDFM